MAVITVIGCGMMGSSIAIPASENGHEIRLAGSPLDDWIVESVRTAGLHPTLKRQLPASFCPFLFPELDRALRGTDVIVSGVSSFGIDWFLKDILPKIPDGLPILSITKGMIADPDGSLLSYPEYYRAHCPGRSLNISAVGGPCTSYELADKDPTQVTFCGPDMETLVMLRGLFERPYYHVALSTDVRSVELAVALKNAYALGTTLAVGMAEAKDGKLHYNSQAALFGQSIREMRKLLLLHGCSEDALYVGAGDLYVTIFGGRTRLIGTLLGKDVPYREALESLKGVTLESTVISERMAHSLEALSRAGRADPADFPLLMHISRIMRGEVPGSGIPWEAFRN